MRLRDLFGISPATQRRLTWLMEVMLVGLLFVGLERGSPGIVVNAAVALAVTQLPPLLERDYEVHIDPGIVLWLTTAVFLHALGTVGLPGAEESFYRSVWWWDHLTHALSSSVVAGVGYAVVRAIDVHSDAVVLPRRFLVVFLLVFVVAFGVFWEVIEFVLGELAAALGTGKVLTQYGLDDTMLDLAFDLVGAVVVAVWGTAHLSGLVETVARRFETG
ncbi:MAG: hypothetical protein ABEH47_02305 [Haloferacaceae archaeon]